MDRCYVQPAVRYEGNYLSYLNASMLDENFRQAIHQCFRFVVLRRVRRVRRVRDEDPLVADGLVVKSLGYPHLEILCLNDQQQVQELACSKDERQIFRVVCRGIVHSRLEHAELSVSKANFILTSSARMTGQKFARC